MSIGLSTPTVCRGYLFSAFLPNLFTDIHLNNFSGIDLPELLVDLEYTGDIVLFDEDASLLVILRNNTST